MINYGHVFVLDTCSMKIALQTFTVGAYRYDCL